MIAVNHLVREKPFGWYDEQYPGQLLACWQAFVDDGDTGDVFVEDVLYYREGLSVFLSFNELEQFAEFQTIREKVRLLDETLQAKLRGLGKFVPATSNWWSEIASSDVELLRSSRTAK